MSEEAGPTYPPGHFNQGTLFFKGHVREDIFGRKYIDRCPTEEHHLTLAVLSKEGRSNCRFYIDDIISREMVGVEAEIEVEVRITPCRGATDVRDR
jgi:hypothetical protein